MDITFMSLGAGFVVVVGGGGSRGGGTKMNMSLQHDNDVSPQVSIKSTPFIGQWLSDNFNSSIYADCRPF